MTKFHVNDAGEALRCSANIKCQFGLSLDQHFETRKEARDAFEAQQEAKVCPDSSKKLEEAKPLKTYDTRDGFKVIDPDDVYNSMDHSMNYTPEQAKETFDAQIKGKRFQLKTDRVEEPGILLEKLFGKIADSISEADLGEVELKTIKKSRVNTNVISLSRVAMANASNFKAEFTGNMDFNKYVKAGVWTKVGDHYYALLVDHKSKRVRVIVGNEDKKIIDEGSSHWTFEQLNEKVDNKLENIAVATYSIDEKNNTAVYDDISMGGFTHDSFIDAIANGDVLVEFRKRRGNLATVFKASHKVIMVK